MESIATTWIRQVQFKNAGVFFTTIEFTKISGQVQAVLLNRSSAKWYCRSADATLTSVMML